MSKQAAFPKDLAAKARAAAEVVKGPAPWSSSEHWITDQAKDLGAGAKSQLLRLVLGGLAGGAALGGTVTGLSGLHKMWRKPEPPSMPDETDLKLPYPQIQKTAAELDPSIWGKMKVLSPDWWKGRGAKGPMDLWQTIPAMTLGVGGGVYGGHKLMESILHRRRKAQLDQQLQEANKGFEQSLMSQYKPETIHELKTASSDPLDDVYDNLEKKSALSFDDPQGMTQLKNWAPTIVGSGLTGAGILAAIAARGGYRTQAGRSQEELLQQALKNKAYLQSLRSPPPISFEPSPVAIPEPQPDKKE